MKRTGLFKTAARLVLKNPGALFAFEIVYKLALALVLVPLLLGGLHVAMALGGYSYITSENLLRFALHPVTLLILALIVLIVSTLSLIDIYAVLYALEASRQNKKARLSGMALFALKHALRSWRLQNLPIMLTLILMAPLLNAAFTFNLLTQISIPEPIARYLSAHTPWLIVGALAVAVLSLAMVRRAYVFHLFTLEKKPFAQARSQSAELSRGHLWKDFCLLGGAQLALSLGMALITLALVALAVGAAYALKSLAGLSGLTEQLVLEALRIGALLSTALLTPCAFACISALYERRAPDAVACAVPDGARPRLPRAVIISALLILLTAAAAFWHLRDTGRTNPNVEYLRQLEITAHRGASGSYPENTMAAFRGALELGADWIELDVQQTRDGRLVVMHDRNVRRVTGVNGYVWRMSWEELSALDAGALFGSDFAGERIPLLEEVLAFAAENDIRLNIELKPSAHDVSLEKGVLDLVDAYDMREKCVITSQAYSALERVKAIDPEITTVYVARIAYGDIDRLTAADHFSVEASSATRQLVTRVHRAGKQIYAWTVNSEETINSMIAKNVDNIITDDVELARRLVYESRYSELLGDIVELLEPEEETEEPE